MSSKLVVCCGDIAIFRIFKMAGAAILYFWNSKILLAIGAERIETHQLAKLDQNRPFGCEDIKIFWFFKMAATAILDCRIHKNLLADSGWPRRITLPNFVKIGQTAAIFRFFKMASDFVRGEIWLVPKASHWLSQWLLTQGWHNCAACDSADRTTNALAM